MSTILNQIKADQVAARKAKLTSVASVLTTLIGEAEMIGKNSNRVVTDQEVVALVKKFIKNIDETIAALGDSDPRSLTFAGERVTLEKYLPQQMTEDELKREVRSILASLTKTQDSITVGDVMKSLKARYDGRYDGRLAASVIKGEVA